ncbi:hypothetical protein HanRHA438_Chr08g0346021 [Helianthus annuus]|nr:hypothetical protein HanRHA438_Chr08g0346021 [Helianthus annuus]
MKTPYLSFPCQVDNDGCRWRSSVHHISRKKGVLARENERCLGCLKYDPYKQKNFR